MKIINSRGFMSGVVFINNYQDYANLYNNNNGYRRITLIFMKDLYLPEINLPSFNVTKLIGIPNRTTEINVSNCLLHGSFGNGFFCNKIQGYFHTLIPKTIQVLKLSSNYIHTIDLTLCEYLRELDVCNNKITNFHLGIKPFLEDLNCSKNEIDFIDLEYCTSLKKISIYSNKLTNIQNLSNNIRYINASNNKLNSFPNLPPKLEYLNLSNNNIHQMVSLSKLCRLETLYLSNNKIKGDVIIDCDSLTTLDLRNNQISNIVVSSENIKLINLNLNKIKDIYLNTPKLTNLCARSNMINYLNLSDQEMNTLDISNNPLRKIIYPRTLSTLWISGCKISYLNNLSFGLRELHCCSCDIDSFINLPMSLKSIYYYDNPILDFDVSFVRIHVKKGIISKKYINQLKFGYGLKILNKIKCYIKNKKKLAKLLAYQCMIANYMPPIKDKDNDSFYVNPNCEFAKKGGKFYQSSFNKWKKIDP